MIENNSSESINNIEVIEQRARHKSDNLQFPPINDHLCEGDRSVGLWVQSHLNNRIDVDSDEALSKAHLEQIGQNSSLYASRFRGALLGLALGDALGTTLEFSRRDSLPPVTEIIGGGPFKLAPGDWTDDTSMALCLAHSLIRKEYSSNSDQLDLYCLWWKKGIFGVKGKCFDIGNTVVHALENYMRTGNTYPGPTDPRSAGNGSLMRLAPVALFYFSDPERCASWCGVSSETTHRASEAIDACRYFGILLHGAIKGASKAELSEGVYEPTTGFWDNKPLAAGVVNAALNAHTKNRDQIKSSGYVIDTLEAAIWAFHNSHSFEEGAILAANLGDDADTVAAVYGQLAGAYYGELNIDPYWIKKLSRFHIFYLYADKLMRFGLCDAPQFLVTKTTPAELTHADINLRYVTTLEQDYQKAKNALDKITDINTYPVYPKAISGFMEKVCQPPWFDRSSTCSCTVKDIERITANIETASIPELCCVLVGFSRFERFSDGYWIGVLEGDRLGPVIARLKQLVSV